MRLACRAQGHAGRPARPIGATAACKACVGRVSVSIHLRDGCRIVVHLPNDRARFALRAIEIFACMCAAHERHPASALVCDSESRYTIRNKSKKKIGNAWMTTDGVVDHGHPDTALSAYPRRR